MKKTICFSAGLALLLSGLAYAALPPGVEEANIKARRAAAALELTVEVSTITGFRDSSLVKGGYACAEGTVTGVKVNRKNAGRQDLAGAPEEGDWVSLLLDCQPDGVPPGPGQARREACSAARRATRVRAWSSRLDFAARPGNCAAADSGFEILAGKGAVVEKTVYDFKVRTALGTDYALAALKGKVALIVNVASNCGYTPQYEGLEELHAKYAGKGLAVLGFPCNQFGGQEPGRDDQIQKFCRLNYGVTFPVMGKIEVNGPGADPLYKHLKAKAPGVLGSEAIKWNFTKFLVDREGRVLGRYAPQTKPEALVPDIEKALALP